MQLLLHLVKILVYNSCVICGSHTIYHWSICRWEWGWGCDLLWELWSNELWMCQL